MIKALSTLLLAMLVGSYAQAQAPKFGVKAGGSLTEFVGKDGAGYVNKVGFHGGLVAELSVTDHLAVQPEVLYSMKGAQFGDIAEDIYLNETYLDIPVLLKWKAERLFFEAGPQLGLLLASKYKREDRAVDNKSSFNTVDVGYAAGVGYALSTGPFIGLRYNGGIRQVGHDVTSNGITYQAPNIRNSAFQLYVGFLFGGE